MCGALNPQVGDEKRGAFPADAEGDRARGGKAVRGIGQGGYLSVWRDTVDGLERVSSGVQVPLTSSPERSPGRIGMLRIFSCALLDT